MLPVGMLVATAGYTLLYWGVKLWGGQPVTFSYALGLSKTNTATQPSHGADLSAAPAMPGAPPAGGGGSAPGAPAGPSSRLGPAPKALPPLVAPPP